MLDRLSIVSPKRNRHLQTGWEGFFPYYAGYPESFAESVLQTSQLSPGSIVLDPWNGSGTTTYAAAQLGHVAIGLDLNPVMIAVARARMLPPSEADSLEPLSKEIIRGARERINFERADPLLTWFDGPTARAIRSIERSICKRMVGRLTLSETKTNLDRLSSIAAAHYVALFAVCRDFSGRFRSSNPTWVRKAGPNDKKISVASAVIEDRFLKHMMAMSDALSARAKLRLFEHMPSDIRLADSTALSLPRGSVDFILTSPPYCTRIDYAAATRVELAIMSEMVKTDTKELSRQMIGSTRVPMKNIEIDSKWGQACYAFLERVRSHGSKASSGYYFRTHLDYFDKMARSLDSISSVLRRGGVAILILQDSFYKDVHNDLPTIVSEIAEMRGLKLSRRQDFHHSRSMAGINRNARTYARKPGATESVVCFLKTNA